MTSKQAEQLYRNQGRTAPSAITTPSANKFNARRKEIAGISFASGGEASCYQLLKLQERAGIISQLELQPEYLLQEPFIDSGGIRRRAITYTPDFRFLRGGRTVVVEFKGVATETAYIMRKKLFLSKYPEILFEEWRKEDLARL